MPGPTPFNQPPSTDVPTPTPIPAKKNSPLRALSRPATWRWVIVVVGLLLAAGSGILLFGAQSQAGASPIQKPVTYKTVQGTLQFIEISFSVSDPNTSSRLLVSLGDSNTFYYWYEKDYPPNTQFGLAVNLPVTLIYRPDKSIAINETSPGYPFAGYSLQGTAYQAVQVTVGSQNPKVSTSKEYTQYLQAKQGPGTSAIQNNLRPVIGIAGLVAGLLIALSALLVPMIVGARRKKQQASLTVAPTQSMGAYTGAEMQPESGSYQAPPQSAPAATGPPVATEMGPQFDASQQRWPEPPQSG